MPILKIIEVLSVADKYVCLDGACPADDKFHEIEVTFYCECEYRGRLPEAAGFNIVSVTWDVVAQNKPPQKLTDYIAKWVGGNIYHLSVLCDDQYSPDDFRNDENI